MANQGSPNRKCQKNEAANIKNKGRTIERVKLNKEKYSKSFSS